MAYYRSANGKLLITGEYFVLDGAKALAMPTQYGQQIQIAENKNPKSFSWQSNDAFGVVWFQADFKPKTFEILSTSDSDIAKTLQNILIQAAKLGAHTDMAHSAFKVETWLTYPREWGLGSSSTLIYLLSEIFYIDPYTLLEKTFGGSGYDIACADQITPIIYRLQRKNAPDISPVDWNPPFSAHLYFLYLNKKQNSREGIALYSANTDNKTAAIDEMSEITEAVLTIRTLHDFERLITDHENLVQSFVKLPRAKFLYFSDYWGEVKSLGAWGGDFCLVTSDRSEDATRQYFSKKGFDTLIPFDEMRFQI